MTLNFTYSIEKANNLANMPTGEIFKEKEGNTIWLITNAFTETKTLCVPIGYIDSKQKYDKDIGEIEYFDDIDVIQLV